MTRYLWQFVANDTGDRQIVLPTHHVHLFLIHGSNSLVSVVDAVSHLRIGLLVLGQRLMLLLLCSSLVDQIVRDNRGFPQFLLRCGGASGLGFDRGLRLGLRFSLQFSGRAVQSYF